MSLLSMATSLPPWVTPTLPTDPIPSNLSLTERLFASVRLTFDSFSFPQGPGIHRSQRRPAAFPGPPPDFRHGHTTCGISVRGHRQPFATPVSRNRRLGCPRCRRPWSTCSTSAGVGGSAVCRRRADAGGARWRSSELHLGLERQRRLVSRRRAAACEGQPSR